MKRWWTGVALLAGWVGSAGLAWTQAPPALPVGPSMPEPLPVAPGMSYGAGPAAGVGMPPGSQMSNVPGPGCTPPPLDCNFSAFTDEQPSYWNQSHEYWLGDGGWYTDLGMIWLQRRRGGHAAISLEDVQNVDSGIPAPLGSPTLQSYHDLAPSPEVGTTVGIGYFWDTGAIEFKGFFVPESKGISAATLPGRINTFFYNPPIGFEGDNGMWLQADRLNVTMSTQTWSAELNTKWWSPDFLGIHALIGLRYFDIQERINYSVDDDTVSFKVLDFTRQAQYIVRTKNQIAAAQLGFETEQPILPWLGFSMYAKGAWGANFFHADYRLLRGDGLQGFFESRNPTLFSSVYEVGVFADFYFASRWHARAGYNFLWAVHLPEITEQVNYNLALPTQLHRDDGSIFWYGPSLMLQVQF